MPAPSELASQVTVKLNGSEVQQPVMTKLTSVVVDQHTHMPDMFILRFHDPELELLDHGPFNLTNEIEIGAERSDGEKIMLVQGEITALEPNFGEGMIAELVVRGYDRLHRLYRETHSKAYLNVKDSDLAEQIAQAAGLQSAIDITSAVYEHLYQQNQSDLAFLMERAWRIGFECFVSEGKLFFRKPHIENASLTLTWGDDLLSFNPRMTLAEQVDEVVIKGWDIEKQTAIVGQATQGNLYPKIGEAKDGAGWAHAFGLGKMVIVNQPVVSQAEADALAAARLDEISGSFIDAEGVAFRRPDIRAGKMVNLQALGERFSGDYLVTSATHLYTAEGLRTIFKVSGSRSGLLSEQLGNRPTAERWPGVVVGIVTNTDDPQAWGRVKVKFPWMAEEAESAWARVAGIGAGPKAGLFVMPEVGDEVLVAFEYGDFNHPVVIGGLWNGKSGLPDEAGSAGSGEKPLVRTWRSRSGHRITMYDNADKKVELFSANGESITLDDNAKSITIKTDGVKISLENNKLVIEGDSEISIKANANLKLEASGNIDIQADGQVNVKGAMVNLN
jgi:phage protein D/phage baseplate assembly protein gpV